MDGMMNHMLEGCLTYIMVETNSNDDNNEEEDLNGFEYGIGRPVQ